MSMSIKRKAPQADQIFQQYASQTLNGPNDDQQKVMTPQDFIDAIAPKELNYSRVPRDSFSILLNIADSNSKGYITLDDWIEFERILSLPDADFEIAFRFFDKNKDGIVTPEEFRSQYLENKSSSLNFDWNTQWAHLYFGRSDRYGTPHNLTYNDFSQMMTGILGERIRQGFIYFDKGKTGSISVEDFEKLVNETVSHKASPKVLENLKRLPQLTKSKEISYSITRAFFNVLNHSDLVDYIAKSASEKTKDGLISKELFMNEVARSTRFAIFSPIEIDILFFFAGINGKLPTDDNRLHLDDFKKVIDPSYQDPATRYKLSELRKIESAKNITKDPKGFLSDVFESAYNFGLGAVAGIFGATMVYPIDLVKTRMQNQRTTTPGQILYKNSWDCFKKVLSREGFFGLYSGLGPQLVGVAPEKAIKLTINDLIRGKTADKNGKVPVPWELVAGGCAGACQVIFTNPLEIVKIRLQVQGELMKTDPTLLRRGAISVVKSLGLLGLYKGASACLLRDVPFSAIYFPTYSHLKKDYFGEGPGKELRAWQLLIAGAIAGIPAAYLTTPCDVVKTRLQVESRKGQTNYVGLRHAAGTIWKEEGFKAFFKGGIARILRSSPQFGFTLAAYEVLHSWFPLPGHPKTEEMYLNPTSQDLDDELKRAGVGIYGQGQQGLKYLKSRNALRLLMDIDQGFGKVNQKLLDKCVRKSN